LEVGADGFLSKPLDRIELVAQIRAMVKVKAANRSLRVEKERLEALVAERTAEVQRSEARHSAMFENMASASCIDEIIYEDGRAVDYRILDINPAFERLTGILRQNARGALASELYGTGHAPFLDVYSRVAETGTPAEFQAWFAPIKKHLHITVGCPEPGYFSTVFTDITERKQAEEAVWSSRELYSSLVENLPQSVFRKDREGRFLFCNQRFCETTGRAYDEIIGRTDADLFPPTLAQTYRQDDVRVVESGQPLDHVEEHVGVDGRASFVQVVKTPLRDASGAVVGVQGIFWDITERKRAEEAQARLAQEWQTTFDGVTDAIWLLDADQRILRANRATETISGCTADAMTGKHCWETLHNTREPIADCPMVRARRSLRREQTEMQEGERFYQVTVDPILDANGKLTGAVHIVSDITERKQAEAALRTSEERFSTIFRTSPMAIALTRVHDNILVDVNSEWEYITGYSRQDAVGRTAMEIDLWVEPAVRRTMVEALHRHDSDAREAQIRRKTGELRDLSMLAVIVNLDGHDCLLSMAQDITDRKHLEHERHQLFLLAESSTEFIGMCDLAMTPFYVNPAGRRMVGLSDMASACRANVLDYHFSEDRAFIRDEFYPRVLRDGDGEIDIRLRHFHTGEPIWMHYYLFAVRDSTGQAIGWATVSSDITERRLAEEEKERLQAQLAHAQKMDSVGRLAGGVAHDFNNMLMAILVNVELAQEQIGPDHSLYTHLVEIQDAAKRSADLTRQLLTFARKQTVAPKVLDLNETVEGTLKMLRRLIGEHVGLIWRPGADPGHVFIDPSQVDQILANLCVNARDAIADTGEITIETGSATFDQDYCARYAHCVPGEYVLLSVTDNGSGMDAATLGHLFEPFFTTKELGKGTGLGLATVFGAVKQSNGFVDVSSEPGNGTTVRIYLPRHMDRAKPQAKQTAVEPVKGTETILLVEDESAILRSMTMMLESMGYAVLAAVTPRDAIRLAGEYHGAIDLLVTDVVMPEMNGRNLAESIRALRPGIRCVFMSGYTADVIAQRGVLNQGVHFLQKPFTKQNLAQKVREALDSQ
jgi:PAS domain S-box-containing protein